MTSIFNYILISLVAGSAVMGSAVTASKPDLVQTTPGQQPNSVYNPNCPFNDITCRSILFSYDPSGTPVENDPKVVKPSLCVPGVSCPPAEVVPTRTPIVPENKLIPSIPETKVIKPEKNPCVLGVDCLTPKVKEVPNPVISKPAVTNPGKVPVKPDNCLTGDNCTPIKSNPTVPQGTPVLTEKPVIQKPRQDIGKCRHITKHPIRPVTPSVTTPAKNNLTPPTKNKVNIPVTKEPQVTNSVTPSTKGIIPIQKNVPIQPNAINEYIFNIIINICQQKTNPIQAEIKDIVKQPQSDDVNNIENIIKSAVEKIELDFNSLNGFFTELINCQPNQIMDLLIKFSVDPQGSLPQIIEVIEKIFDFGGIDQIQVFIQICKTTIKERLPEFEKNQIVKKVDQINQVAQTECQNQNKPELAKSIAIGTEKIINQVQVKQI